MNDPQICTAYSFIQITCPYPQHTSISPTCSLMPSPFSECIVIILGPLQCWVYTGTYKDHHMLWKIFDLGVFFLIVGPLAIQNILQDKACSVSYKLISSLVTIPTIPLIILCLWHFDTLMRIFFKSISNSNRTIFSGGFLSLLKGWLHKASGPRATKAEEFLWFTYPKIGWNSGNMPIVAYNMAKMKQMVS